MQPILLDRVRQTCGACPGSTTTHIIAAWLSLTRVCLETKCPVCGWSSTTYFDLLKLDDWLQSPDDAPLPLGHQHSPDEQNPG